jgi:hypothetical protein
VSKTKKRKPCIFCRKTPVTEEHVFPKWMSEALRRDPRGLKLPAPVVLETAYGEHRWVTDNPLENRARCVCAGCNNGWMSAVEAAAKPAITAMMRNESCTLGPVTQQAIATWGCLKTIIGRYYYKSPNDPSPGVRQDWRDYLFTNRKPSGNWLVLIGRYDGKRPQWSTVHHFPLLRDNETGEITLASATEHDSLVMTLIVGYFAIKVLGIVKSRANFPGYDFLLRIWPQTSPLHLIWPPPISIRDDATLQRFEQLFVDPAPTPIL